MNDDELDLWKRYRAGDQQALEELLIYHIKIVRFWAGQIARIAPRIDLDDLMQEGLIALARAIELFELHRGFEFSTYARHWVSRALYSYLRTSRALSHDQYNNFIKVEVAEDALMRKLGHKPTIAEIAEEAGLTPRQVELAQHAMAIADPRELIDPDAFLPTNLTRVARHDDGILINELLSRLDKKKRWIITEYYYFGREDNEIAKQRGLTTGSVKMTRRRALQELRDMFMDESGGERHED